MQNPDNWKDHQMAITGYASNDRNNGQIQISSLKVDPYAKCVSSHDIQTFFGSDENAISLRFKLNNSLPRNFQPSLLCARNSEGTVYYIL